MMLVMNDDDDGDDGDGDDGRMQNAILVVWAM
jgi:hypothetical protein